MGSGFLVLKHISLGLELFNNGKNLKSERSLLSETFTVKGDKCNERGNLVSKTFPGENKMISCRQMVRVK